MKQSRLVKKLNKALLEKDNETVDELRKEEYRKIFVRKAKGKAFNNKWTVVRF
jgi:hypothetical protein